jgi:SAM-dependent methyltransferase
VVRNFYGRLEVIELTDGAAHIRWLKHGVIFHGSQATKPPLSETPTLYFGETSGIGRTILSSQRTLSPMRIGSIGLGTGTLAAYGRPHDVFRVYELNPADIDIAQNQFSYLKDSKARVELVPGDARLSLESEIARKDFEKPEQKFDVLSVDAFSGDAIPVHLLTREAFAIYARVIKPDGVIAFHITNRYLNLAPVVEQVALDAGFQAVLIADRPDGRGLTVLSDWMIVTRSNSFLQQSEIAAHTMPFIHRSGHPLWTDQYSNLLQAMK